MIRIDKLSKKYDKEYVLNNLSCTIKDNCIYGLVGAIVEDIYNFSLFNDLIYKISISTKIITQIY